MRLVPAPLAAKIGTPAVASAALVAVLGLAACGGDGRETTGAEGDIHVSGSSTVAPITAFVADEFNYQGSPAQIAVDDPGTGDGFAQFCDGSIEVAGASRPIKDVEVARCEATGVRFVELEIALDGVTVLTSAAGDDVDCLTFADLYALLGPEAGDVDEWDDAEPLARELGSTTDLPDARLDVTAPGTESGTYDAFVELVIAPLADARVEAGELDGDGEVHALRTDYSSQADDNSIIAGIVGSRSSLGFVGFSFAEGAGDEVRSIAVDGGEGCVAPSVETIADGTYPVSRSLYVYVNADDAEQNQALAEYVDFMLTDLALEDLVAEAGYVPLPDDRVAATRERWRTRTTGAAPAREAATAEAAG